MRLSKYTQGGAVGPLDCDDEADAPFWSSACVNDTSQVSGAVINSHCVLYYNRHCASVSSYQTLGNECNSVDDASSLVPFSCVRGRLPRVVVGWVDRRLTVVLGGVAGTWRTCGQPWAGCQRRTHDNTARAWAVSSGM